MTNPTLRKFFAGGPVSAAPKYDFWDESLLDHINMALAIGRPLLLTGKAGVGKSSIARAVADAKDWGFVQATIRSRMEAAELRADFDAVMRLSDASAKSVQPVTHYVTPQVLWKAYDPEDARAFLARHGNRTLPDLEDLIGRAGRVLLIDEIDKGDLDFANDFLDVFDQGSFTEAVSGHRVTRRAANNLLVVITSNAERDLSAAFLRRCIQYKLVAPDRARAANIGAAHLAGRATQLDGKTAPAWFGAQHVAQLAELAPAGLASEHNGLNVSRFVDLIDATLEFGPQEAEWDTFLAALQSFASNNRGADWP
jgi:MoxR-like ATPase